MANNSNLVIIENEDTFNLVLGVLKENQFEEIEEEEIGKIKQKLLDNRNIGIILESKNFSWFSIDKSKTIDVILNKLKDQYENIKQIPLTQIPIIQ